VEVGFGVGVGRMVISVGIGIRVGVGVEVVVVGVCFSIGVTTMVGGCFEDVVGSTREPLAAAAKGRSISWIHPAKTNRTPVAAISKRPRSKDSGLTPQRKWMRCLSMWGSDGVGSMCRSNRYSSLCLELETPTLVCDF